MPQRRDDSLELPIVLTNRGGRCMSADSILFDAWAARETLSAFADLAQILQIRAGRHRHAAFPVERYDAVRITKRDDGANGVIRWEGVFCEPTVYTQSEHRGRRPRRRPRRPRSLGRRSAELMDIPLLRDADDSYGFYAAALGYLDAWRGAQLYLSRDGGGTYDDMESGLILDRGDHRLCRDGARHADLARAIRREMHGRRPARRGLARERDARRGPQRRERRAPGRRDHPIPHGDRDRQCDRYGASPGSCAGASGTDWAVGDGHAINERFVLLDRARCVSCARARPTSASITWSRPSRSAIASPARREEPLTYEGVNLTPLAPVQLAGGRDPTGNLNFTWIRRTRLLMPPGATTSTRLLAKIAESYSSSTS
jgi:hypothetical protein